METYVSTAPPQPPRTSIQMFGDYLQANWRISVIIVLLMLCAASTLCGLFVRNMVTLTTNTTNSTNLLTTTNSTSTALVMLGSATTTELTSTSTPTTKISIATTTAIACNDGLLAADDGKCYACILGSFDTATATCSCDKEKNFISNSAGDGCECDAGYLINEVTGECIKCDTTSNVFQAYVNGVCQCKQDAFLVDGSCECATNFILAEVSSSCVPCQESTGAFLTELVSFFQSLQPNLAAYATVRPVSCSSVILV